MVKKEKKCHIYEKNNFFQKQEKFDFLEKDKKNTSDIFESTIKKSYSEI